jgi:DNA-binding transcriptional LysR family regulator
MPRWAGHNDPAAAAYWSGTDVPPGPSPAACASPPAPHQAGPEINDITQLLDAVALGNAVAYVPASTADQHRRADLAFVPVTDLSPSLLVAAWPDTSRSHAVAAFVRAAADVAADHAEGSLRFSSANHPFASGEMEAASRPAAGARCGGRYYGQ